MREILTTQFSLRKRWNLISIDAWSSSFAPQIPPVGRGALTASEVLDETLPRSHRFHQIAFLRKCGQELIVPLVPRFDTT